MLHNTGMLFAMPVADAACNPSLLRILLAPMWIYWELAAATVVADIVPWELIETHLGVHWGGSRSRQHPLPKRRRQLASWGRLSASSFLRLRQRPLAMQLIRGARWEPTTYHGYIEKVFESYSGNADCRSRGYWENTGWGAVGEPTGNVPGNYIAAPQHNSSASSGHIIDVTTDRGKNAAAARK